MATILHTVPTEYNLNERLDKYIANNDLGLNRSQLKSGVTSILINGKEKKLSYKVNPNDTIEIQWEEAIPDDIIPENIPLEILYEDENVCVVNKKQGMVTHPACGNWNGTLVNALLYHWGKEAIHEDKNLDEKEVLANRRPGIVHRLDKETSGIIITAKNKESQEFLCSQFASHKNIRKEYICICMGRPSSKTGIIRTGIIRDPRDRKKFKAVEDINQGKYAESVYNCIACYGEYSLMRVKINTGRTHQIRVHMKYINCPILGDSIYSKTDKKFPKATLMLNSSLLKIKIPGFQEYKTFRTPTPERFKKIMKTLQKNYKKVILG